MNCSDVRDLLSAYLDNVLDPDENQQVADHLGACPHCREELQTLRETISLLHSLGEVEPPPDFHQKLHARLQTVTPAAAPGKAAWLARFGKAGWLSVGVAAAVFFITISLSSLVSHQAKDVPTEMTDVGSGVLSQSSRANNSDKGYAPGANKPKILTDFAADGLGGAASDQTLEVQLPAGAESVKNDDAGVSAAGMERENMKAPAPIAGGEYRKGEIPSRRALLTRDQTNEQFGITGTTGVGPDQVRIARRLTVRLEVGSVAGAAKTVGAIVAEVGGVVERTAVSGADGAAGSGNFQARVPGADTKTVVDRLNGMGKLIDQSVSEEDVTAEYADSLARLQTLRGQEQEFAENLRLGNYRSKAAAQADLDKVQREINSEQEHLANLQRLSGMTTVSITVSVPENRNAPSESSVSN